MAAKPTAVLYLLPSPWKWNEIAHSVPILSDESRSESLYLGSAGTHVQVAATLNFHPLSLQDSALVT